VGKTEPASHSLGGWQPTRAGTPAGGRAALTEEDLAPTMNLAQRFGGAREGGQPTLKGAFDVLEGHEAGNLAVMRLLEDARLALINCARDNETRQTVSQLSGV
jgi:hypothetical protein